MNEELRRLMAEKKELERRIKLLTTGAISNDLAKVDRIGFAGKFQQGKWALFFKYAHIVNAGSHGVPQARTRWTPLINGDSLDDVVRQIPDAIKALQDIYEEAIGHGTDT